MTKILILSDIHGNKHGLQAVLDEAPAHDHVLCLGDVVGYGAFPNECCEILREKKAISLLGNHDAAVLGQIDVEWFNPIAKTAIEWTQKQLSSLNREWLETLAPQMDFPEWEFQAVHASLRVPLEEYIVGKEVARLSLERMTGNLCFFGHTHVAEIYAELNVPGEKYQLENEEFLFGGEVEMEPDWKYLLNPGSCGQPRDGCKLARAAFFEVGSGQIEVFSAEYPIEYARAAILEAGLPAKLGDRLRKGR